MEATTDEKIKKPPGSDRTAYIAGRFTNPNVCNLYYSTLAGKTQGAITLPSSGPDAGSGLAGGNRNGGGSMGTTERWKPLDLRRRGELGRMTES